MKKRTKLSSPLLLCLHGRFFGKSIDRIILLISDTRSLTFSWCAVKWAVTNKNVDPKSAKDIATAPFVRNAVPGLTDKLASSGREQNQIKSLLMNTIKCIVPITRDF